MRGCTAPWLGAGGRVSSKRCAGRQVSAGLSGRGATRPRGGAREVLKLGRDIREEARGMARVLRKMVAALTCCAACVRDMASCAACGRRTDRHRNHAGQNAGASDVAESAHRQHTMQHFHSECEQALNRDANTSHQHSTSENTCSDVRPADTLIRMQAVDWGAHAVTGCILAQHGDHGHPPESAL